MGMIFVVISDSSLDLRCCRAAGTERTRSKCFVQSELQQFQRGLFADQCQISIARRRFVTFVRIWRQ